MGTNTNSSNMDSHGSSVGPQIAALDPVRLVTPGTELAEVLELYERGRYVDALKLGSGLGDVRDWPGPDGRVMAGRLANNLGAPRLGRTLHWLAYRRWPEHPYCLYYGALSQWSRIGTLQVWRRFRNLEMPADAEPRALADWMAAKALMLASLRDFSRADALMAEALRIDPDSAWLHVERCEVLDRQDAHEAALDAAREALRLQPWFRPAIQSAGHKLVQLNRDDEALHLLSEATRHLQSGDVWCQLGALQQELKDYDAAWNSLSEAEALWPLAGADSQHRKWLAGQRSDIAYYRGDYEQAIELAKQVDRPFYDRLAEKLVQAASQSLAVQARIQLAVPFIRQHHDTCAPATLTALAMYWKREVKHEQIVERICYEGTMASDERRWAEENGFLAREFRITEEAAEQLIRAGVPFTLNTVDPGSAHLQAVVGIDTYRGTFLIQDPSERHVGEAASDKLLEHYASTGPRGMVMLPVEEAHRLDAIELPEAELYDLHYEIDRAIAVHDRETAEVASARMQKLAPDQRLTLQSALAIARYDSNTPAQLQLSEKLLEQFPSDANLILQRLACLSELGSRQQRLEILREVCDDKKSHPIFWSRLASELLDDARDHAEAEYRLNKVLRFHQSDGRSMALLGNLLWDKRQREEALELYRIAASVSEKDEGFARTYFWAARFLHQTQTAKQWLEDRLLRFGKRSALPGRTMAWAYEQLDQTPQALQLLEATARQHADDGELQCHVALTLGRYNQPEKAAEYLAAAKGKCAESTFTRTAALIANFQGRLAAARDLFLAVYERDPLDVSALEYIVSLDMDLDGTAVAEQRLRAAVANLPHSYSLRVQLIQWLRSNRLDAAVSEVDRFLADYPQDAWGYREAAIIAALAHDLGTAQARALTAIELEPTSDVAHFILGRIAAERGDILQARQHFRHTLEQNCDHEGAIAALIETCDRPAERLEQLDFVLGQLKKQTTFGDGILAYREAAANRMPPGQLLAGIEEAITNRPDLWQCWAALVQQHVAMNDRHKAVAVAREATERFPLIPRMWVDLALVYRTLGEHDQELTALERARAINPTWTEVARELSEVYMRDERYDQAEELLRQVLAADPRSPGALAGLADCLYRGGKQQEALAPMQAACELAPAYAWAWQSLIDWSRELDGGNAARAAAEKLIADRPHDARGPLHLAECLSDIEQIPAGLTAIDAALDLDARNIDAHLLRAFYLGRLHRWDEALEACSPSVFGDEIPVALRMRRAYVLYRKGWLDQAIEQMQVALREDPDHGQAWSQLADWADEAGNEEVYLDAAENLLRIDPHQPMAHGYLADALLRKAAAGGSGKDAEPLRQQAKEHLLTAIKLSPDYSYGTMRLAELCLEDQAPDEAQRALDVGGQHLPDGYLPSLEVRIAAAKKTQTDDHHFLAVEKLVEWCQQGECDERPLVQAVDHLEDAIAQAGIQRLTAEIRRHPENESLGAALGRLSARVQDDRDLVKMMAELPVANAWHKCFRFVLRSMASFERKLPLLKQLKRKFRVQAKAHTTSWASLASTLLDFGQTAEVVSWTKDWRQREDLTPVQCVTVVASNYESLRTKDAQAAIVRGIQAAKGEAVDGVDLLHIWAGLDAIRNGEIETALKHAQQADPHRVGGWYLLGYRLLVSAVESLAQAEGVTDKTTADELLHHFDRKRFLHEREFHNDKLTAWFLLQIQARLAKVLGRTTNRMVYNVRSWWFSTQLFLET